MRGQRCEYINFVVSGTLRAYFWSKEEKESTVMFAINDCWITEMNFFMNHPPVMLYIEAIDNIEGLELDFDNAFDIILTGEIKDRKMIMLLQYLKLHRKFD